MATQHVHAAMAALAQELRLAVFRVLVQAGPEGVSPGKMGEQPAIPPSSLSFHLKELTHARPGRSTRPLQAPWRRDDFHDMPPGDK